MKRLFTHISIVALLSIVALSALCGCGSTGRKEANSKPRLYVTIAPLRPLIQGIVGDDFDVEILVPAGASPESFEPTPRQFIALNKSQAVFSVGLIDFERNLVSKIEDQSKVVNLSHGIKLIAGSCSHNHNHNHDHAHTADCDHQHHAHGVDPHVWSSPVALYMMSRNAYKAIAAIYPDSAKYRANFDKLSSRLAVLDFSVRARCERARSRSFIIYHPALTYLARDYGLEQISIEHEGKEPTPRRLASLVDQARSGGVKVILNQPQYSPDKLAAIASECGADVVVIDPLADDILAEIAKLTTIICGQN